MSWDYEEKNLAIPIQESVFSSLYSIAARMGLCYATPLPLHHHAVSPLSPPPPPLSPCTQDEQEKNSYLTDSSPLPSFLPQSGGRALAFVRLKKSPFFSPFPPPLGGGGGKGSSLVAAASTTTEGGGGERGEPSKSIFFSFLLFMILRLPSKTPEIRQLFPKFLLPRAIFFWLLLRIFREVSFFRLCADGCRVSKQGHLKRKKKLRGHNS